MRFAFSDEQLAMRDAVCAFLENECPPEVVRGAWTNDTGRSGLWPKLGEMGVLGVLAPEEHGGFGGDELDLVLLLEETGRAALPEPVVEHAAVAVPLLDDERASAAAAGDLTITVVP
ncbi:MAG TPA: acyl-CoA dehydrogenase family protein, partial [Acidimicrobiia bacterium]|nr:acyl-CoA dehydrogenase family protein [Acidimicrobiia bacterium]